MFNRTRRVIARLDLVDRSFRAFGIASASSGFAHFVAPKPFIAISAPIFPEDTEKWVKINGASEAAIGLALLDRRTRPFGVIGLLAYGAYLGERAGSAVLRYARDDELTEPSFAD